jgi:hypothetical protein
MSRADLNEYLHKAYGAILLGLLSFGVNVAKEGFSKINSEMSSIKEEIVMLRGDNVLTKYLVSGAVQDAKQCLEGLKNHEGRLIILERPKP